MCGKERVYALFLTAVNFLRMFLKSSSVKVGVGDGRRQKVAVSSCRYRLGKLVGDLSLKEQWGLNLNASRITWGCGHRLLAPNLKSPTQLGHYVAQILASPHF